MAKRLNAAVCKTATRGFESRSHLKDMKKKNIFKKFEDKVLKIQLKNRAFLSRHKFIYSLLGATGVVLYWRGVWHTVDILESWGGWYSFIFSSVGSLVLGVLILSFGGILVQELIGTDTIVSGLKKQKRDIDKTVEELIKEEATHKQEKELIKEMDLHLHKIDKRLKKINENFNDAE